jgi:hypothetical protein
MIAFELYMDPGAEIMVRVVCTGLPLQSVAVTFK